MASMLFDSLHGKLFSLADTLEIDRGHQAGSTCGAGLSAKPSSTLRLGKRWNPMLCMQRTDFVDALTAQTPQRPAEHSLESNAAA